MVSGTQIDREGGGSIDPVTGPRQLVPSEDDVSKSILDSEKDSPKTEKFS